MNPSTPETVQPAISSFVNWLLTNSQNVKNIFDILVVIIGGICAIFGIAYLSKLREKRDAAIFGYWSQLLDYLKRIDNRLTNPALINNLYSQEVRNSWGCSEGAIDVNKINDFKEVAEKALEFIRGATDQMPAYIGWTDDYNLVTSFLDIIILYDISVSTASFLYTNNVTLDDRNKYYNSIKEATKRMKDGILEKQKEAEKKLTKSKQKKNKNDSHK